jgi:DNA-binding NarL/FixJ family response regulator
MSERIRIVLADDHRIVAEGVRGLLQDAGYDVAAIVEDGRALLRAVEEHLPDIVVADVSMPSLNGIEAAEQLKRGGSTAKIIFLTMHPDVRYAARALAAGACGFVLKHSAPGELLTAVREALGGRTYVTPRIAAELKRLKRPTGGHGGGGGGGDGGGAGGGDNASVASAAADPVGRLTPRQREVLQLVAEGRSAKEVANVLNISPRTAEFHKYRLMEQLGVTTNAELVQYAMRYGLVAPD